MAVTHSEGEVDLFGDAELRKLVKADGPCLSLFMPTHRAGPETRQDPIRFRNLLDTAQEKLSSVGLSDREVESFLSAATDVLGDEDFWRHQSDGLALFVSPERQWLYRVPVSLAEDVMVGDEFRLRPLLPLLTFSGHFFLLALSQNEVRFFQATRSTVAQLPLGDIPASMGEALRYDDREAHIQFRSSPGADGKGAIYHGHEAFDKAAMDRFLRAVERGLWPRINDYDRPLVLACVSEYLPWFQAVSRYDNVLDRCVAGNPDGKRPAELQAEAWELVAPVFSEVIDEAVGRYHELAGSGRTAAGAEVVNAMAEAGRVDTLFTLAEPAAPIPPGNGEPAQDWSTPASAGNDLIDRAVANTLLTGGVVLPLEPEELPDGDEVSALLRY